jgi:hypothetical protein
MAVTNDHAASPIVNPRRLLFEEGLDFTLQGGLQHLPGSFPNQRVQWAAASIQDRQFNHASLVIDVR